MKKILFLFLFSLALSSCSEYIDVNEDQSNNPSFDLLKPNQMLAGAINNYTTHQNVTLSRFGNRATYVWGLNSGFTSTEPLYSYQLGSGDYTANFENTFLFADNFQDILDKEAKYPDYSYHFGVAKVFKVMCMDYATALYGDVPYSEAFNLQKYSTPKYDDDKTIIPKLFVELDQARNYFNNPSANVEALGSEDIVFGGVTADWLDFINTIELRLLMRLSKTTDASLVALRSQRFLALTPSFIATDVRVNPGYNLISNDKWNPIFRTHGLDATRTAFTSENRAAAAGDFIANILNGTLNTTDLVSTGVVDPRRSRMFTLTGSPAIVRGNVQGTFPPAAISRYGSFFFGRLGVDVDDADNNAASRDMFLMQHAESLFLQAEAVERGYMAGSSQSLFDQGVTASFNFYGLPYGTLAFVQLNPAPYLAAINTKQGLGWGASTDKINCIITQKYLALAQWHGIELYIDHLRTGYPKLPLPVGASQANRPFRLIYPTSEYTSNSANVPNVVNADLYTNNSKTPYYLQ